MNIRRESHMNKYYKLLVMFGKDDIITRKRLLASKLITEELIYEAEQNGYIIKVKPSDIGEVRYMITQSGIKKRDA
jgi:hypothetical protein